MGEQVEDDWDPALGGCARSGARHGVLDASSA
jgi:hypothetical protein